MDVCLVFFFSNKIGNSGCALVAGVQTCALPIWSMTSSPPARSGKSRPEPAAGRTAYKCMSSLIFRFFVPYMFVCAGQPAAAGQGRCKQAEGETNTSGQKRYAAVASGPERSPAGTAGRKRRSEERRVGKDGGSTFRSRWSRNH